MFSYYKWASLLNVEVWRFSISAILESSVTDRENPGYEMDDAIDRARHKTWVSFVLVSFSHDLTPGNGMLWKGIFSHGEDKIRLEILFICGRIRVPYAS